MDHFGKYCVFYFCMCGLPMKCEGIVKSKQYKMRQKPIDSKRNQPPPPKNKIKIRKLNNWNMKIVYFRFLFVFLLMIFSGTLCVVLHEKEGMGWSSSSLYVFWSTSLLPVILLCNQTSMFGISKVLISERITNETQIFESMYVYCYNYMYC